MKPDLYRIPGPWSGKLAVSTRPRGGDWLEDEVKSWNDTGLDTNVSLLEPAEAADLGQAEVSDLTWELASGSNVAVHCRQGIGRSGMVAVAALIFSGPSSRDAVDIVSRSRGLAVPETPEQLRWLGQLASESLVPASS
jgi:hypothetical protein